MIFNLPGKLHKSRVECHWQEEVAGYESRQGKDSDEVGYVPWPWHIMRTGNHHSRAGYAEYEGELEAGQKSWHFPKERNLYCFLSGGAPTHIDLEEVAEDRLSYVQRAAAQEDGE